MRPTTNRNCVNVGRVPRHLIGAIHASSARIVFFVGALVSIAICPAQAEEYQIDTGLPHSARFISDAPLEDIEGITNRIDGYVSWSDSILADSLDYDGSRFYFEVEVAGFDTGIGLRNRHMRDRYLHTEKHPYSWFDGHIDSVRCDHDCDCMVYPSGEFSLHGVTRSLTVPCRAVCVAEGYQVTGRMLVNLSDYDIEVPSLMMFKIDDTVEVILDFHLTRPSDNREE